MFTIWIRYSFFLSYFALSVFYDFNGFSTIFTLCSRLFVSTNEMKKEKIKNIKKKTRKTNRWKCTFASFAFYFTKMVFVLRLHSVAANHKTEPRLSPLLSHVRNTHTNRCFSFDKFRYNGDMNKMNSNIAHALIHRKKNLSRQHIFDSQYF